MTVILVSPAGWEYYGKCLIIIDVYVLVTDIGFVEVAAAIIRR